MTCIKMDELQFDFIDFISIQRWERSANNKGYGQIIFSDVFFLRLPAIYHKTLYWKYYNY